MNVEVEDQRHVLIQCHNSRVDGIDQRLTVWMQSGSRHLRHRPYDSQIRDIIPWREYFTPVLRGIVAFHCSPKSPWTTHSPLCLLGHCVVRPSLAQGVKAWYVLLSGCISGVAMPRILAQATKFMLLSAIHRLSRHTNALTRGLTHDFWGSGD